MALRLSVICLTAFFLSTAAMAEYGRCSTWVKRGGSSCTFAGQRANAYMRSCENPCSSSGQWSWRCDRESVCSPYHPATFAGDCDDWIKYRNVRCHSQQSDRLEQKWVTVCTTGRATGICSDQPPSNNW